MLRPNPDLHDLSGQPVPEIPGLGDEGDAVAMASRGWRLCEQERRDVSMKGQAGLDVAVVLDIDGVSQDGPVVAVVVSHVVDGVQGVPWRQEEGTRDRLPPPARPIPSSCAGEHPSPTCERIAG